MIPIANCSPASCSESTGARPSCPIWAAGGSSGPASSHPLRPPTDRGARGARGQRSAVRIHLSCGDNNHHRRFVRADRGAVGRPGRPSRPGRPEPSLGQLGGEHSPAASGFISAYCCNSRVLPGDCSCKAMTNRSAKAAKAGSSARTEMCSSAAARLV